MRDCATLENHIKKSASEKPRRRQRRIARSRRAAATAAPRVWAPLKRAAFRDLNGGKTARRRATTLPRLRQRCVMVEPGRHPRSGSVRGGINARTATLHWALRSEERRVGKEC